MELLKSYSITEIITIIIIMGVSVKGFVSFWDWGVDRLKKVFNKETQEEKIKESFQERFEKHETLLKELSENQKSLNGILSSLSEKVNLLIDSDKDDIKSWITREHHNFCYNVKWIDDYSLDCIEKRYNIYISEGGNSFIDQMMAEIRDLPKQPPT